METKKSIREMLAFQDLSEEEKRARGILGRLYGPCASVIAPTRNGRKYDDELWEKVFNENDIVKEMFANGGIPMELDHPADREETCSEKIAAMLPEAPKRDKDGHLICYVDLIDTPCGRIAYQLAKYGFKLGISSRGTGDLYTDKDGNEAVDPDTYDFTTFDLVLLPAVKDARLQMTESLDTSMAKAKKAIKESYEKSSEEEKRVMAEELDRLNISLDESKKCNEAEELSVDEIPWADGEEPLVEKAEDDVEVSDEEIEEEDVEQVADAIEAEEEAKDDAEHAETVKDFLAKFDDYDKDMPIEFKPILIDGNEYSINEFALDDSEEGKLVVELGYDSEMNDNIEDEAKDEVEEPVADENVPEEEVVEEIPEEAEESAEEADDAGDEVIESLKEVLRQKNVLEQEVKQLKSEKTVSDVEVGKLKEDVERYRASFIRTSEIAAKATKLESENKSLTEKFEKQSSELAEQRKLNEALAAEKESLRKLNESVSTKDSKVKILSEKLEAKQKELDQKDTEMTAQTAQYKKSISEKLRVIESYKAKFNNVLVRYVESKAEMLGVRPAEITSRLNENYSIDDVDRVCEDMFDYNINMSKLPFNLKRESKVRVTESAQRSARKEPEYGYEIDDSLLELAGLKK